MSNTTRYSHNLQALHPTQALLNALNTRWHRRALQVYMVVVLAHWVEHLLQAFQVYVLGWPRPRSLGALGMVFPWLVSSEWLHYMYAMVMLLGLVALLPAFQGRSRLWWMVALVIQIWHHFEHLLLLIQVLIHTNFFGAPVPTSILQLVFPRMELHLFYNAVVFVPMLVALYYHRYPPAEEAPTALCTCARREIAVAH